MQYLTNHWNNIFGAKSLTDLKIASRILHFFFSSCDEAVRLDESTLQYESRYQVIQFVPFSSPSWRSLNPLKGSRFHHPKNVTLNHLDQSGFSTFQVFLFILIRWLFSSSFRGFFCPFLGSPDLPLHLVKLFRMGVFPRNGDGRISRCRISLLLLVIWISKSNPPWNLCWH